MKSIMHDRKDCTCYLCLNLENDIRTQSGLEEHHIYEGTGRRKLSEAYGLKVYLCRAHHSLVHMEPNRGADLYLKKTGQRAFERIHPEVSFREVFGRNYIDE